MIKADPDIGGQVGRGKQKEQGTNVFHRCPQRLGPKKPRLGRRQGLAGSDS